MHSYLCGAQTSQKPHFHPESAVGLLCNNQQENINPNTDISALISDQHFSLLHIIDPQNIDRDTPMLDVLKRRIEDHENHDTLARAVPEDTDHN